MTAPNLKKKFIDFFLSHGHQEIPSASLIPQNDSGALFISAGMHPLIPYLQGQPHPLGKRLVNVQKCLRTSDIDEVGDICHHTFFEMLGNWSLGDYSKKEMVTWSFEFLTKHLTINPKHLHVTCFAGDKDAPKDEETAKLWQHQGILSNNIHFLGKKDNWWGPAGSTGPCGPDTEMFTDTQPDEPQVDFKTGCQQGRYIEIWNDVFMEYYKEKNGKYSELKQENIDTGMGVERTVTILSGLSDNYLTDIWQPIIKKIEKIADKSYQDNLKPMRIIADHVRSAVFIIADGVEPSNKEAGYVLRRLIRRSIRQAKLLDIASNFTKTIAEAVLDNQKNYADDYPELNQNKEKILSILQDEENRFRQTLNRGLNKISQLIKDNQLSGLNAFNLYQSYGFPLELIQEEAKKRKYKLPSNFTNQFNQAKQTHSKLSQTLSVGKFKSGLADNSKIITNYHTATHLLHAALRVILGSHVKQSGSNITAARLRFDFTHPEKLNPDQIQKIQKLVNQKIKEALPIKSSNLPLEEAKKQNALAFFGAKYPETVSVYSIGNFSKEICTGPHAKNTKSLGVFKIIKQESSGSGKRRLYATLS